MSVIIQPDDFPKKEFAEALTIGDEQTIKMMFKESDVAEIQKSLERYKQSLSPSKGGIEWAQLGWQQFRNVPVVALIRLYPDEKFLSLALQKWCGLRILSEIYESYKYRQLYINNKPVTISNFFRERNILFLFDTTLCEKYIKHNRYIYSQALKPPIAWQECNSGVMKCEPYESAKTNKWRRGETDLERAEEFEFLKIKLFGVINNRSPLQYLSSLEEKENAALRKGLDTTESIDAIIKAFYERSCPKPIWNTSSVTYQEYPGWYFDVDVPYVLLFYKRLCENLDEKIVYVNEFKARSLIKEKEEVKLNTYSFLETFQNYADKSYFETFRDRYVIHEPFTWVPYAHPDYQICACHVVMYFLSPTQLHQTYLIARFFPEIEFIQDCLRWMKDPTEEKIKIILEKVNPSGEKLKYDSFESLYNRYCHKVFPVVPHTIVSEQNYGPSLDEADVSYLDEVDVSSRDELVLVVSNTSILGLLLSDQITTGPEFSADGSDDMVKPKYHALSFDGDYIRTIIARKKIKPLKTVYTESIKDSYDFSELSKSSFMDE